MDWSPFLTVVATGAVTLTGVWLNGRYAARGEQRRLAAEQARLDSEIEREAERLRREDQSDARERNDVADAEARELASEIAETFLNELRVVREFEEVDDAGFVSWYKAKWSTRTDIALRRLVGRVRDNDERARALQIVDTLDMFDELAEWDFGSKRKPLVEKLLTLGFDVSATVSRGQQPDDALGKRLMALTREVNGWIKYQDEQRELQIEQWRAEAAAKKAARAESVE